MAWGDEPPGDPSVAGKTARAGMIRRIAIVEDEIMVAWSIETMLEDGGYDVVGVYSSGEDALAGLVGEPVDLLCMDINLGHGIDGIETARRIANRQPVAVIFISAYSDAVTTMRIREAVPDAVLLAKPVTSASLHDAIGGLSASNH